MYSIAISMKIPVHYKSPEEALSIIKSGNRVFIQGSSQTPTFLLKALADEAPRLKNVELVFISVYGDIYVDKPQYADSFYVNSLFVSASIRDSVNEGRADYVPVFLSEIPELFK
ncbi:MAG TPA: 4-hydroxybutyrate CoA-transferase, partial [Verrucomicrobiae bacterium]|nr:4-hydroxybutyrate CoA-transferase [Verrucomicrobiae bacterium]